MNTFLRPNTALVERRAQSGKSLTGSPLSGPPDTIHTSLGCLIDPISVGSRMGGDLTLQVEGVIYTATDVGFFDGVAPYRFPSNWEPGQSFALNGVTFTISTNGRAAFPDIRPDDRVTAEDGRQFLVLAVARYYDIVPNLQARLAFGRSW